MLGYILKFIVDWSKYLGILTSGWTCNSFVKDKTIAYQDLQR